MPPPPPPPANTCDPALAPQVVSVTVGNLSTENLQDYPVAVVFDGTTFDFSQAVHDGSDLGIWDAQTQQPLPYWLEAYNPALGRGLLWVKLSSLLAQQSSHLWLTAGIINHCTQQNSSGYNVFPFFSDVQGISSWNIEDPITLTHTVVSGPLEVRDKRVIQSDGTYNSTPGVAEAANGDWVLSYRKGTTHVNSPLVILRRSQDNGVTWSPEVAYWDTTGPDPSLARTPGGDLLIEFVKKDPSNISGAAYSRSTDNGLTWSPFTFYEQPVSNTSAFPTAFLNDGPTMYAASYGPSGFDSSSTPFLWFSTDDGFTWTKRSAIRLPGEPSMSETAIAQLVPGSMIAISRADDGANTYGHFSADMGLSWGSAISYTSQVGVLHEPQLVKTGDVLVLLGREDYFFTTQLVAYLSYDGGQTFTYGTVLDHYLNNPIDGGYCWPLLLPDGRIFVVHYSDTLGLREPDIKSLVLQVTSPQSSEVGAIHLTSQFLLARASQSINLSSTRYALDFRFRSHDTPVGNKFAVTLEDTTTQPAVTLVGWEMPSERSGGAGFVAVNQLVPMFSTFTFDQPYRLRTIVDETLSQQTGEALDDFGALLSATAPQPFFQGTSGHANKIAIGTDSPRRNTDTLLDFLFIRSLAATEPQITLTRGR